MLVPNRDIGIQAQGDLLGNRLFYAGGIVNGIPDGASLTSELDTNDSKDFAGRVVLQPFRSVNTPAGTLNGFGFQLGGSAGRQSGSLPTFKTSAGQTFFSYAATAAADGERRRLSPALFYYYKAFGGFAEYMRSTQSVARPEVATDVRNQAWNTTATYLLTGEPAGERGVQPQSTSIRGRALGRDATGRPLYALTSIAIFSRLDWLQPTASRPTKVVHCSEPIGTRTIHQDLWNI